MTPILIKEKISADQLREIVRNSYGQMAKVTVDLEKEILSIGCEMHFECANQLMENGSSPQNIWGANIYPEDKNIDFVSLINIRPSENPSMEIKDEKIRNRVAIVIKRLLFYES